MFNLRYQGAYKYSLYRKFIVFIFLFLISCSTTKKVNDEWCEDVFIPGNKYYETNLKHQDGYEIPPVLHAKDILPANMLRGASFEIQDEVYSDGTIDHFQLNSEKWGDSIAAGYLILKTRINEIYALDTLSRLESGSFFKGIAGSLYGMVTAPWSFMRMVGGAFTPSKKLTKEEEKDQKKLEKIKEKEAEKNEVEEDDSDLINPRLAKIIDDDKDYVSHVPYNTFNKEEHADVGTIQSLIGTKKNIVEILERFHIDPDNTNPILHEKIRNIAKMESFGGLSTMALPAAPVLTVLSTTKTVVGTMGTISVYSDSKEQQKMLHDGLLLAGCSEKLIKRFESCEGFSKFLKIILANNVIKLRNVKNASEIIKIAILVDDYEIGWIVMQTVAILPTLYNDEHFIRFVKNSPLPTVVTKDNKVLIAFAGDHLYWIRDTALSFQGTLEAIEEDGVKPSVIEAHVKGIPSQKFKDELAKLGIKLKMVDRVEYQITLYND